MTTTVIRAVAFDLDGLMFNTEELYQEVGAMSLRSRGKELTKELLDLMIGRPGHIALQTMIDFHELDATVKELQAENDANFARILPEKLSPLPGLLELLEALEAANIPKAVTTSSRLSFVKKVLSLFDLEPRFEFLLTSEDVVRGKPEPEIYQKASDRFAVTPPEMMVLEDSEAGTQAAVAAGAFTVSIPGDHSRDHDFAGAQMVAESLEDPRIRTALQLG